MVKKAATPADVPSLKPAAAKLGMKPGHKVCVLGSPKGFVDALTPRPAGVRFTAKADPSADLFLCFVRSGRELQSCVGALAQTIDRQTLWVIWPKKTSGVTSDIDGNIVRESGLATGWVDFKVCSIDATWSGLAFKRRR